MQMWECVLNRLNVGGPLELWLQLFWLITKIFDKSREPYTTGSSLLATNLRTGQTPGWSSSHPPFHKMAPRPSAVSPLHPSLACSPESVNWMLGQLSWISVNPKMNSHIELCMCNKIITNLISSTYAVMASSLDISPRAFHASLGKQSNTVTENKALISKIRHIVSLSMDSKCNSRWNKAISKHISRTDALLWIVLFFSCHLLFKSTFIYAQSRADILRKNVLFPHENRGWGKADCFLWWVTNNWSNIFCIEYRIQRGPVKISKK